MPYQQIGKATFRASLKAPKETELPNFSDAEQIMEWIKVFWRENSEAVEHASPVLGATVKSVLREHHTALPDLRKVLISLSKYSTRFNRSTPFGYFAGVCDLEITERKSRSRFGEDDKLAFRPDSGWLRVVTRSFEQDPKVLKRLKVQFRDDCISNGRRVMVVNGDVKTVLMTPAVEIMRKAAEKPIAVIELLDALKRLHRGGDPLTAVLQLVSQDFMLTDLQVPTTSLDPLGDLICALERAQPLPPQASASLAELKCVQEELEMLNSGETHRKEDINRLMRSISHQVREPLGVDIKLDAEIKLSKHVVEDVVRTAEALPRICRLHTGNKPMRDYHLDFVRQYGTNTVIPILDVVSPTVGIGFPEEYLDVHAQNLGHKYNERDEVLLSWVMQSINNREGQVRVTEAELDKLSTAGGNPENIPPHLDMGIRIHARSCEDIESRNYTYTIQPGRVAGTFTSRFDYLRDGIKGRKELRDFPAVVSGAEVLQLSFTPPYGHAENVSRLPLGNGRYVSVGEFREPDDNRLLVREIGLTACAQALHIVDMHSGKVVEPLIMHALAPKQQPALARLLGAIPRGYTSDWLGFDWGPVAGKQIYRPEVRYGKAILSPEQWMLRISEIDSSSSGWMKTLSIWSHEWRCPAQVELHDFDQRLLLNLDNRIHAEILRKHMAKNGEALLSRAPCADDDGWCGGRPHLAVIPLGNRSVSHHRHNMAQLKKVDITHVQSPGAKGAKWVYLKLFADKGTFNDLIRDNACLLTEIVDGAEWWFVRFPRYGISNERDHLRIRVAASQADNETAELVEKLSAWANTLRDEKQIAEWTFSSYCPEVGRYGSIDEAETIFCRDSMFVARFLIEEKVNEGSSLIFCAVSMIDIVVSYFCGWHEASQWFMNMKLPQAKLDSQEVKTIGHIMRRKEPFREFFTPDQLKELESRRRAIGEYSSTIESADAPESKLHSLLHMHHNRLVGVDRESEAACLRMARHGMAAWRSLTGGQL